MQELTVLNPNQTLDSDIYTLITHADERGYIAISHGKWRQLNMSDHCQKISQWKIKARLYVGNNQQPTIVNSICSIKFPNLKQINLWGNNIESFQLISRIDWPALNNFSINGNSLVEFRSFRKSNMRNLKTLGLSHNKIRELSTLTQFNSKTVNRIILEFQGDREMCNDISWLARLQSFPKDLYIMSNQRIEQQGVHLSIKKMNQEYLVRAGTL